jgi:hypothetical protein
MAITTVQSVTNLTNHEILFVNTETSRDNRYIHSMDTESAGAWVPWCSDNASFPFHHLELIDESAGHVLAYVWQHRTAQGDFVRISRDGYEDEGAHLIEAGKTCKLWVAADGTITAKQA